VYGFVDSEHPLSLESLVGVGAQAPALRAVRCDDLAAVVSDAPNDLRGKRRDLEAHHRVLEALGRGGTVLPMRFGMLATDDEAIRAELASGAGRYRELLARLDGKVELNVKVAHQTDSVLAELLREHRSLRDHNDALRVRRGGSYADKVRFGERLSAAIELRRARDARRVLETLRPHAFQACFGAEAAGCFVNASFLVGAAARQNFEAALVDLRQEMSRFADVRVFGPLPPYSFVSDTRTSEPERWVC
jgi:hypothetical protein